MPSSSFQSSPLAPPTREALPHFYPRQATLADDLNQLFAYDDAAWRAHNRAAHGCGVVCGLEVRLEPVDDPRWAVVSPGYAVSPAGDEIEVTAEAWLSFDCARTVDDDCDTPSLAPAYIVLRPTKRHVRGDGCRVAVCDGYEVACSPERPACSRDLERALCGLTECEAERLIHAALLAGDLGATGVFGCGPSGKETVVTLARVDFAIDARTGRRTSSLAFEDRVYVPAVQVILRLAQLAGVARLKRPYTLPPAVSFLGAARARVLRVNRGFDQPELPIRGRRFQHVRAIAAHPGDVAVGAFVTATSNPDTRGLIDLRVPLRTVADVYSLRLTTHGGETLDTAHQTIPVTIQVHDTPFRSFPTMHIIFPRHASIRRLLEMGFETFQQLALITPAGFTLVYVKLFGRLPDPFEVGQLLSFTRAWLAAGAPGFE